MTGMRMMEQSGCSAIWKPKLYRDISGDISTCGGRDSTYSTPTRSVSPSDNSDSGSSSGDFTDGMAGAAYYATLASLPVPPGLALPSQPMKGRPMKVRPPPGLAPIAVPVVRVAGIEKVKMEPLTVAWTLTSAAEEAALAQAKMQAQAQAQAQALTQETGFVAPDTTGQLTTLMFKSVPRDFTRDTIMKLLDDQGFSACYDFLYLPFDFVKEAIVGYAFVNFISQVEAERAYESFQGFSNWRCRSEETLDLEWAESQGGLAQHLQRFRNCPVMHPSVPERFRPVFLQGGVQQPFPESTKRIVRPRLGPGGRAPAGSRVHSSKWGPQPLTAAPGLPAPGLQTPPGLEIASGDDTLYQ